jgi:sugar phosphate permease
MRGTAFGLFNHVTGGALLMASLLAGWLGQAYGPIANFAAAAIFSELAALIMALSLSRQAKQ